MGRLNTLEGAADSERFGLGAALGYQVSSSARSVEDREQIDHVTVFLRDAYVDAHLWLILGYGESTGGTPHAALLTS